MKETIEIDGDKVIHKCTYTFADMKEIQESSSKSWPTTVSHEVPQMRYDFKITYNDEEDK